MKILGIIPARFGSTRFPGKPLAVIHGKPMIQWTYENSSRSKRIDELIVATDDTRIFQAVTSFGGKVVMTSGEHSTGTDRLIEVAKNFPKETVVINVQGDEPGIDPNLIDGVIDLKLQFRNWHMTTAACPIENPSEIHDVNRVKVVFNREGKALYFSRSSIPSQFKKEVQVYKHLGIYCYEIQTLLDYNHLPESELEASESLEQLRALEAGLSIGVFVTQRAGLSVDVPDDIIAVEEELKRRSI